LREHDDPAWFKPRKAVYEAEVLMPPRHLIVAVGAALEEAGLLLVGRPATQRFPHLPRCLHNG